MVVGGRGGRRGARGASNNVGMLDASGNPVLSSTRTPRPTFPERPLPPTGEIEEIWAQVWDATTRSIADELVGANGSNKQIKIERYSDRKSDRSARNTFSRIPADTDLSFFPPELHSVLTGRADTTGHKRNVDFKSKLNNLATQLSNEDRNENKEDGDGMERLEEESEEEDLNDYTRDYYQEDDYHGGGEDDDYNDEPVF